MGSSYYFLSNQYSGHLISRKVQFQMREKLFSLSFLSIFLWAEAYPPNDDYGKQIHVRLVNSHWSRSYQLSYAIKTQLKRPKAP